MEPPTQVDFRNISSWTTNNDVNKNKKPDAVQQEKKIAWRTVDWPTKFKYNFEGHLDYILKSELTEPVVVPPKVYEAKRVPVHVLYNDNTTQ